MDLRTITGMIRPWSLPMSLSSVLLGGAIAYFGGYRIDLYALFLALIATLLLHAGTNVLNDASDVSRGIDRPGVATAIYRNHPVLQGEVSTTYAFRLSLGIIFAGLLLGAYISYITGPAVFGFEVVGAVLLMSYTGPLINSKVRGFGEFVVMLAFGTPLVMGGFAASTGGLLSLNPFLVSVFPSMLMMAVIYSNFYRDRFSDAEAGIRSFAMRTQKHGYMIYSSMVLFAYVIQVIYIIFRELPASSLLTLLTLPYAIKLLGNFRNNALNIDAKTGILFMSFNLLLALGLIL